MSKYTRHQSVIYRQSESYIDENNWLHKLEKSLEKSAVQPRTIDQSIFEQISSVMGNKNKSKHTSVEAAVEDMKNRSGLTAYLKKINKISNENKLTYNKKIATNKKESIPIVITKCPSIDKTIQNYIQSTKGNLHIPAIIDKIKSIHQSDVSDASDWEDDNLIKYVSKLNLSEKSKDYNTGNEYNNLGKIDSDSNDNEIDPSNTDAFHALNPVKF